MLENESAPEASAGTGAFLMEGNCIHDQSSPIEFADAY